MNPDCFYCGLKDGQNIQHECVSEGVKKLVDSLLEAYHKVDSKNLELRKACERLLKFNEDLCDDIGISKHYPSADFARKILSDGDKCAG